MLNKNLCLSWLPYSTLKFVIICSGTSFPDCCTRQLIAAGGEALRCATLSLGTSGKNYNLLQFKQLIIAITDYQLAVSFGLAETVSRSWA